MKDAPGRLSGLRLVSILVIVGVLALVAVNVLAILRFRDPLADRFLLGAELEGPSVVLRVGDCLGGQLQSVELSIYDPDGAAHRQTLWHIEAAKVGAPSLVPGEPIRIAVGVTPEGTREVLSPPASLPRRRLVVDVRTEHQWYGLIFALDELESGRVLRHGSLISSERFAEELRQLCD